ncbi:5'-3' exoribonuclease 2 [Cryptococcus depauperatus]
MGVPALFRWLSKKYPKIVTRVKEDFPKKVRGSDGELIEEPIRYENPNPNGFEVDNLYLDMNGIVHPCTHPEGKPAPETEEEMMVEIFKYTERVVNMCRPRKVLMLAIDGVAPRAKMNQQRSRRFRAAQEAADKEEEHREAIKLFEAMGHPVSEETANKKGWDTNAITPGTPFMTLLSISLKYWVSHKLTTDPGWKNLKIILSDSSVPGEGEHKIMDWIRRQRSYPTWDANTSHIIYGLDADLIMLSLATHEPHFRVLREDVFAQSSKGPQPCRNCGKPGHLSANCKSEKKVKDPNVVEVSKPEDPKPFIFLDVACLREYLAIELNVSHVPFPFDLELAIDDWIFMIFFVGNDFLPHLPSLEIREGAIDVLLKIWRAELPRMGGYVTNHGKVNLERAQVILEGLAKSEDEIFQKRKQDEERQEHSQKRRRIDEHKRQDDEEAREKGVMNVNGTEYVAVSNPAATARGGALHPSLPTRPSFDLVPKNEVEKTQSNNEDDKVKRAMAGSNSDIVKNRRAIRMANMSAAQALKAELDGDLNDTEVDLDQDEEAKEQKGTDKEKSSISLKQTQSNGEERAIKQETQEKQSNSEDVVNSMPVFINKNESQKEVPEDESVVADVDTNTENAAIDGEEDSTIVPHKRKRSEDAEENDDEDNDAEVPLNSENQPDSKKKLKVNADGTVDYTDDVRLWEPGYRERYYEKKFGVDLGNREFLDSITKAYMEGLCWVLEYYYQGVPAWDWYYPYHYAPFAQDFQNVRSMEISFEISMPFKPFAQLLGVFPAASRIHLPEPLQTLMINEDSPILDFYPPDFEIDMNGKKMAWQGVALLPFIDQKRLLDALKSKEDELSDDEKRRNTWGDSLMFVANDNTLFDVFCDKLYGLRAKDVTKPVPIDPSTSMGMSGAVLPDPNCVPSSSFDTPLPTIPECPDLNPNDSISVRYYFPRQASPHRSIILRGYESEPPRLTESDKDWVRRGGQGGRRGPRHSGADGTSSNQPSGGPGVARGRYESGPGRSSHGYTPPSGRQVYSNTSSSSYGYSTPHSMPLPPRPPVPVYGGGSYSYGNANPYAAAPPNASTYAGYSGSTSYTSNGVYGHGNNGQKAPYPPANPYAAAQPSAYGVQRAGGGYGYGAPPRGSEGAYNPYGNGTYQPRNGPPPRRY